MLINKRNEILYQKINSCQYVFWKTCKKKKNRWERENIKYNCGESDKFLGKSPYGKDEQMWWDWMEICTQVRQVLL